MPVEATQPDAATSGGAVRLETTPPRGWSDGLANLLREELRSWWRTRRWWLQALLWSAASNAFLTPLWLEGARVRLVAESGSVLGGAFELYFGRATLAPVLGVIVLAQIAMTHGGQRGIASWVLSKPVSRTAFLLSKLISNAAGVLVAFVALPALVAFAHMAWLSDGALPPIGAYVLAHGPLFLNALFYLALTLMLGTLLERRDFVLGIPAAILLLQPLLLDVVPQLGRLMPWTLAASATALANGEPLSWLAPLPATVAWIALFAVVAVRGYQRADL